MVTDTAVYTLASVIAVSLISFVGAITLSINAKRLKKFLIYFISFAAGALFGDVFLHLLPESAEQGLSLTLSAYVLSGILVFFILEKIVQWKHCHMPLTKDHVHPFATMNLFGDSLHNFIDGLIIGASYLASIPVGIATTLAVVFHEIPQEMGDFGVLLHGGYSKRKALLLNFLSALTAVLGALVALWISSITESAIAVLIPFAAGVFLYIAGSDLIPELHKETKMRTSLLQVFAFLLGIAIMALILLIS